MTAENPRGPGKSGKLQVGIEVVSWARSFLGQEAAGSACFREDIFPGMALGAILAQFSRRYPRLDAALWVKGEEGRSLNSHLEVVVNGQILGHAYRLETRLQGGEQILLLGQYIGG